MVDQVELVERVARALLVRDFGEMSPEQTDRWMQGSLGDEYRGTARAALEVCGCLASARTPTTPERSDD